MIPAHHEINPFVSNEIDEAVLLSDSARPDVRSEVLEWLRLSDPVERTTHHSFDQGKNAQGDAPVRVDPEAKVFPELVLED